MQELTQRVNENLARAKKAEAELEVAREQLKGKDSSILTLKDQLASSEARVARAEADVCEVQATSRALRRQDANDAVDIGAYNILVGRIEVLEAAEGGVVGTWKLDEVKAEMHKWYPEDAGVPGAKLVEFLEEHKDDEEAKDAGDERTASTESGTV